MKKLFSNPDELAAFLGFLSLRLWLALRAFMTGIEKFAGGVSGQAPVLIDGTPNTYGLTAEQTTKVYGWAHYHGVPEALYNQFEAEPLIPGFLLKAYDLAIGPLLILLGLTLLLGIATRISLFAMALLYTSLTFGLILLKQDAGIAWMGVHIALIALALFQSRHNRFELLRNW
ncbi:MAG: hypothetical protein JXR25_02650 [Pontiellaceae bacterium]|nr:hypothetical protein [Pontiellaceae bacterium]MBN2783702.1 hypothetical protein [Pontiellaceae bacterium]